MFVSVAHPRPELSNRHRAVGANGPGAVSVGEAPADLELVAGSPSLTSFLILSYRTPALNAWEPSMFPTKRLVSSRRKALPLVGVVLEERGVGTERAGRRYLGSVTVRG